MPLETPTPGIPNPIKVIKTEEKGSDVNLATHLLWDGFRNDYEVAVVISNDSDLLEPIRIVRRELSKSIGILNPVLAPHRKPSYQLRQEADFFREVSPNLLAACHFPPTMTDSNGTITKPASW